MGKQSTSEIFEQWWWWSCHQPLWGIVKMTLVFRMRCGLRTGTALRYAVGTHIQSLFFPPPPRFFNLNRHIIKVFRNKTSETHTSEHLYVILYEQHIPAFTCLETRTENRQKQLVRSAGAHKLNKSCPSCWWHKYIQVLLVPDLKSWWPLVIPPHHRGLKHVPDFAAKRRCSRSVLWCNC